jgi:hypothetical protein
MVPLFLIESLSLSTSTDMYILSVSHPTQPYREDQREGYVEFALSIFKGVGGLWRHD